MVCQKCQSTKATVHTTTIVNGNSTESYLCAKCSGYAGQDALSAMPTVQGLLQQMLGPFPGIAPLLNVPNMPGGPAAGILDRTCPHCGITLREIQGTGKLGCPHDYSVFGETLSRVIAASQAGAQQHIGKVPECAPAETRRAVLQAKVDDLQRRLDRAVFREDYERAAEYRDEIEETRSEFDQA